MSAGVIAGRYAKALFNESLKQGSLEDVAGSLREISGLIEKLPNFRSFLHNPLLPINEQQAAIKAMFADKVPALLFQYLNFLIFKGRLDLLKDVADSFEALYLEHHRRTRVRVQSAFPLDQAMQDEITQKLESVTGYSLETTWEVVPSMIGGVRIYARGKLYEYSFKNELRDYKRKVLERI